MQKISGLYAQCSDTWVAMAIWIEHNALQIADRARNYAQKVQQ
jgi:hypothetical protein